MSYEKCLKDAVCLVEDCEESLNAIQTLYDKCIVMKEIDSKLLIKMKNVFENLRSSLDFCAQAMVMKFSDKKPSRVYFPYAHLSTSKEEFKSSLRIEKAIPRLAENFPYLYQMIVSMQHFSHPGAKWFPEFMELNNKNKHLHLVPNIFSEGVELTVGDKIISAKSIRLNENASIVTDQGVLRGPLEITPESIKKDGKYGVFKARSWEALFIEGYGFPHNAFQFTSHCINAIGSVVRKINVEMKEKS